MEPLQAPMDWIITFSPKAFLRLQAELNPTAIIAIGIAASNADSRATEKQIMSAKKELGVTRDEVIDVLKVVLLTSGMQPFNKALQIANKVFEE